MQKTKSIALILGVLTMSFCLGYLVLAWTEPSQVPPEGNVPAPLNVGITNQIKAGGLGIGGAFYADPPTLVVDAVNHRVGIGTASPGYKLDITGDVRWTGTLQGGSVPWSRLTGFPSTCSTGQYVSAVGSTLTCSTPAGGGGTVTQLNQGTGIILSPNPITTTGSIYADTNYLQRRVSGICAAGSSIRVIASDGTVTCETDDVGAGIGGSGTTNYVAKFTAATTIGNSQIFDNGTNIGIGSASPDRKLEVMGGSSGLHTASFIGSNGYGIALGYLADYPNIGSIQAFNKNEAAPGRWKTLEINPFGGNVGVGTASPMAKLHVIGTSSYTIPNSFSGAGQNAGWSTGFATQAMSVSILSSSNIVSGGGIYAASDQRLKENIIPMSQEIVDRFLSSAHPVNFNWKMTSTFDSGFIAQDLISEGLGYLVSGVPDSTLQEETNGNGLTSPAGMRFVTNYSSIIPILTIGLQQQQAKIATLSGELASLEKLTSVLVEAIKEQQKEIEELRNEIEILKGE